MLWSLRRKGDTRGRTKAHGVLSMIEEPCKTHEY